MAQIETHCLYLKIKREECHPRLLGMMLGEAGGTMRNQNATRKERLSATRCSWQLPASTTEKYSL